MLGKKCKKSVSDFYCESCDYFTSVKQHYEKHLATDKHKVLVDASVNASTKCKSDFSEEKKEYKCICGKSYPHDSSYYRHKKKCKEINKLSTEDSTVTIAKEEYIKLLSNPELIYKLFEQNMQLQNSLVDVCKQSGSHNNTNANNNNTNTNTNSNHINSNNKTAFNLNFFLNETCKNAMNLSDFVEAVIPTLDELETTGRLGNSEGVSKIILTRLREIEKELRPLHCSDGKREVFYVKENNIWNKEAEEKPLLIKAIKQITQQNIRNILDWKEQYPDCTDSESCKNDLYLKITLNAMPGGTKEETERNIQKIISNIAKCTQIERD